MIDASFDRRSRMSAVSGVYQYDTGQRLRMHGLPSPDELLARDDLLAGNVLTVQVQFGYVGDEQTSMGLATWDEERWIWVVDIPDEYLTRTDPVHVYVYVYYGANEYGERANTTYEGVFTPISRPAPGNVASEDMLERWNNLKAEVDLVLVGAEAAIDGAETSAAEAAAAADASREAAEAAQSAGEDAIAALKELEDVEDFWNNIPVIVENISPTDNLSVSIENETLKYRIPKGLDGVKGPEGDVGPADIAISFENGVLTITPR